MSDYGHTAGTIALIERLEQEFAARGMSLHEEVEKALEEDRQRSLEHKRLEQLGNTP